MINVKCLCAAIITMLAIILLNGLSSNAVLHGQQQSVFAKENLTAWCVVPFDAKKRGPEERAEMLKRLGFKSLAYDWRDEHVSSFDEEIVQLDFSKHSSIRSLIRHPFQTQQSNTLSGHLTL